MNINISTSMIINKHITNILILTTINVEFFTKFNFINRVMPYKKMRLVYILTNLIFIIFDYYIYLTYSLILNYDVNLYYEFIAFSNASFSSSPNVA